MIRHLQRRFCPGPRHRTEASRLFAQPNLGEKYTHIHHAPCKFLRPRFVRRPAQNQGILVHRRPAARRVGQDRVYVGRKGFKILPRKRLRRREVSRVPREAATAALCLRHDHLHAIARQHLDRRHIDIRIEHLLRTTGEQRHPRPALTLRRIHGLQFHFRRHALRRERQHRPQHRRHEPTHRAPDLRSRQRQPESPRIRNRPPREPAPQFFTRCPHRLVLFLHPRAKRTDQIPVRHAARTRRLARQTAQAAIDMRLRIRPRQRPFEHLLHQDNAPARRIHLLSKFLIRRTRREAEPAMHTRLHRLRHRRAQGSVLFRFDRVLHD